MNTQNNPLCLDIIYLPNYPSNKKLKSNERGNVVELLYCSTCATTLYSFESMYFPTGIKIKLPPLYQAHINSKEKLAAKAGIVVLNAPGIIRSCYTGEIKVLLMNNDPYEQKIMPYTKIAELSVHKIEELIFNITDEERDKQNF